MDDNSKVLTAIAVKMLYKEATLAKLKGMLSGAQSPTEMLAKVLATILRQAVADAQKAGAQMSNQVVMTALVSLVKEAVGVIAKNGEIDKKSASMLGKTLVAATTKALSEITGIPKGPAQGAPQGMPPPQGVSAPQQQGGIIGQQMGAM